MGTNYFLCENRCSHCNSSDRVVHIGKASAGWRFGLNIHNTEWKNWEEFKDFIKNEKVFIEDENHNITEKDIFVKFVESKKEEGKHTTPDFPYPGEGVINEEYVDLLPYNFS
mgnify:CR=1 FL=1